MSRQVTEAELREAIADHVHASEDMLQTFPPHNAMRRLNETNVALDLLITELFACRPSSDFYGEEPPTNEETK